MTPEAEVARILGAISMRSHPSSPHDGIDLISRGTDERCVIDGPKFDKKIKTKLAA